jgi:hypothetical protein
MNADEQRRVTRVTCHIDVLPRPLPAVVVNASKHVRRCHYWTAGTHAMTPIRVHAPANQPASMISRLVKGDVH